MRILGAHYRGLGNALSCVLARGDNQMQSADGVGYVLREP